MKTLSQQEYIKFTNAIGNRVEEFFDGYCIVGYHARTGERIVIKNAGDAKTVDGLNTMLHIAANLPVMEPPQEGKEA